MITAIDTNILLDIFLPNERFAAESAKLLKLAYSKESPAKRDRHGPKDQALVIPRGDLLCWQFIDLLKSQI